MAIRMSSVLLVAMSSHDDGNSKWPQNAKVAPDRQHANFQPSIWSDHFTKYSKKDVDFSSKMHAHEIQGLKGSVRSKLKKITAINTLDSEHLTLINDIEGLGLGYHFEEEIGKILRTIFEKKTDRGDHYDLYDASLYFRLLRQHGYPVSSDIFNRFIEARGCWINNDLLRDVRGMLSFYEAAQLRLHEEDVMLDPALKQCITSLESSPTSNNLSSFLSSQVANALRVPIHMNITRLRTRRFISTYEQRNSYDTNLLRLAKLDFNLLQQQHQLELSNLSSWWRNLGVASKCPLARDRMVELYVWSLAMYFEPQYTLAREFLTKGSSVLTLIDDTYDVFGSADEIELLTEAVNRWDTSLVEQMPEHMKVTYGALLDVFQEMDAYVARQGKSYRVHYARKLLQDTVNAYYEEYMWFKNNRIPTMEEFMPVALRSAAVPWATISALVGIGDHDITEETFEWVFNRNNKMLTACSIIGRLKDDIVTHKFEQERGHSPSSVECYTNQHGVSEQEAYQVFKELVASAWKDMNQECLRPTAVVPFKVLERILNIARIVEVWYRDGDGITQAQELMKDDVTSLLVNPIPI